MIKLSTKKGIFLLLIAAIFLLVLFFVIGSFSIKEEKTLAQNKDKKEAELKDNPIEEVLGSSFVIGFSGYELDEETEEIIKYIKPAGIVLYARNCKNEEQLENLISDLQQIAREINDYEFFIMIDEEPGGANRLGAFDYVFLSGKPNWSEVYNATRMMSEVGINVDLAPVADYPFNNNSFIKRRIAAKTVEGLIDLNKGFIEISKENNIFTTLKHFPGMGIFIDDPHKIIPNSDINQNVLEESLLIFKSGIDSGVDFVMTGHAIYENIDSGNPATFSAKIVKDILQKQLGFKGIIITDDLSDMPLSGWKIDRDEAGIKAIKAGHHLIMYSHDIVKTKDIFISILDSVGSDPELKSAVERNYRKITEFKKDNF